MHKKVRNNRANLYRTHYVRKGTNGNTHGYSESKFVDSLPLDSLEIPAKVAAKLTVKEREYVERVVIEPAKRAVEERRRKEEQHERDPSWRIDDAVRLLTEASDRIAEGQVIAGTDSVADLSQLVVDIVHSAGLSAATAGNGKVDPLRDVLAALERAAQAVRDGNYGRAPELGMKSTDVYRTWSRITAAVDGKGPESLLRALQAQGWVQVKKATTR